MATAHEATVALTEHVASLGFVLAPALSVSVRDPLLSTRRLSEARSCETQIGRSAYILTAYAQSGHLPEGESIAPHVETVTTTLWSSPCSLEDPRRRAAWDHAGEPRSSIELVLRAARCRERLEAGKTVSVRDLAALGGVKIASLRQAVAQRRVLSRADGEVSPSEARVWLAERGVAA